VGTANVYVSIKNADKSKPYCVVKNNNVIATLQVITIVGDFGAVMKITPKEAASQVRKGDKVYLKKDVAYMVRPTPAPYVPIMVTPSPTMQPPMQPPIARTTSPSPFQMAPPAPMAPQPTPMPPAPVLAALPPMDVRETPEPEEEGVIIVDNDNKDLTLQEPELTWVESLNAQDSFGKNGYITILRNPQTVKFTYMANIPEDGSYEVFLWWTASTERYRSARVPVTVYTMDGEAKTTVDQTQGNAQFNSLGMYNLKAGERQPVLTISNEEINKLDRGYVSVDAMKLVYKGPVQK
jgi:hypothetical protein